jgi:hypothetical protein
VIALNWELPAISALVFSVAACGGLAEQGGAHDGGADKSPPPSDAESESDTALNSESGRPEDARLDRDAGPPPVDAGPPFLDSSTIASCDANPCGYKQFCLDLLSDTKDASSVSCISIPASCEPSPTCSCVQKSFLCPSGKCAVSSGRITLTCTTALPP